MRAVVFCSVILSFATLARAQEPKPAAEGSRFLLQLKLIEISHTNIRQLGIDFDARVGNWVGAELKVFPPAPPNGGQAAKCGVLDPDAPFLNLLQALEQTKGKQLTRTLAETELLTAADAPGYFHHGGNVDVPAADYPKTKATDKMPVGTIVDFLPTRLDGGAASFDIRYRNVEVEPPPGNGHNFPGFREQAFAVQCKLTPGQTLVLLGPGLPRVETVTQKGLLGRRVEVQQPNPTDTILLARLATGDELAAKRVGR
jgi:hypothetical protein